MNKVLILLIAGVVVCKCFDMPDISKMINDNIEQIKHEQRSIHQKLEQIHHSVKSSVKKSSEHREYKNVNGDYREAAVSHHKVKSSYQINDEDPVVYEKEELNGKININGDEHTFSFST